MVFNMGKGSLIVAVNLVLIVLVNAQENKVINKAQPSPISVSVAEHEPSKADVDPPADKAWQTTTERTLIRVTRLESSTEQPKSNKRQRRQVIEAIQTTGFVISVVKAMQNTESGEEILGMAKKVAIAVIVIASLCTICCLATTVIICVKCCCRKKERERKPGASVVQVPQPIYVHTGPSGYQPQYHQQQVPQSWNRAGMQSPESRPMLPQPSAPPQPTHHFQIEHPPPPYEKLYTGV